MLTLADVSLNFGFGILGWIIIGGLAGALAGTVVRGSGFGILGDIVMGILGALVGGFIVGLFFSGSLGLIGSFIVAFLGAVVLILVWRAITGNRARTTY